MRDLPKTSHPTMDLGARVMIMARTCGNCRATPLEPRRVISRCGSIRRAGLPKTPLGLPGSG